MISDAELEAYLDESLPEERMPEVEAALRDDDSLVERLATVVGRRDAGVHSLAAVWRRHRLTCPSREELGSYLLGVLEPAHAEFVALHVERTGCRYCRASLADLRVLHAQEEEDQSAVRRKRYFQSSAGYLKR